MWPPKRAKHGSNGNPLSANFPYGPPQQAPGYSQQPPLDPNNNPIYQPPTPPDTFSNEIIKRLEAEAMAHIEEANRLSQLVQKARQRQPSSQKIAGDAYLNTQVQEGLERVNDFHMALARGIPRRGRVLIPPDDRYAKLWKSRANGVRPAYPSPVEPDYRSMMNIPPPPKDEDASPSYKIDKLRAQIEYLTCEAENAHTQAQGGTAATAYNPIIGIGANRMLDNDAKRELEDSRDEPLETVLGI